MKPFKDMEIGQRFRYNGSIWVKVDPKHGRRWHNSKGKVWFGSIEEFLTVD